MRRKYESEMGGNHTAVAPLSSRIPSTTATPLNQGKRIPAQPYGQPLVGVRFCLFEFAEKALISL